MQVIAAVRDVKKASDLERAGAELRQFNFDDAASLAAVFKGVDSALVVPPNPAVNSKPFDRANIANKVRYGGLRKLSLTLRCRPLMPPRPRA